MLLQNNDVFKCVNQTLTTVLRLGHLVKVKGKFMVWVKILEIWLNVVAVCNQTPRYSLNLIAVISPFKAGKIDVPL